MTAERLTLVLLYAWAYRYESLAVRAKGARKAAQAVHAEHLHAPDPDSSPFDCPSFENVEQGIGFVDRWWDRHDAKKIARDG